jgi:hypothetical protein
MTEQHSPITPPPELVQQWVSLACEYEGSETWIDLATQADWKALCAELLYALENEGYAHWVHTPDEDELCLRARAALAEPEPEREINWPAYFIRQAVVQEQELKDAMAQPEPERPTPQPADGEVAELVIQLRTRQYGPGALDLAADLLERLSPPRPTPVSERLPGPGDCDAEGRCWYGAPDRPGAVACWDLEYEPATDDTHWLPAHALPVPAND